MADAIPAANAELLAAQAKSGMEGVAAYQQAQATLAQQRSSAVQTAMQEAALRGAPAGAAESQAGIIAQPYDQRIASLVQGQAAFQGDMAARDRRFADYNAATNKARDLIPGEVEKIVAPIRAQGEATIRNTTRQGEMAVSEIDANTRLALAKMQAAEAAARRAAAEKAAKEKKEKKNELKGTDLQAMLAQGVRAMLQGTVGKAGQMAGANEAAAAAAAASKTKMNPGSYTLSTGATAIPRSTAAKPVPPTRHPGEPPEGFQERLNQYKRDLAGYQAQASGDSRFFTPQNATPAPSTQTNVFSLPTGATARTTSPIPQNQQASSASLAQQIAARLAESQAPASARPSRLDMREWLSPQYGSFTPDQLGGLTDTDPFLASLIAGSPEPLNSGNIGRMLAGEPDANNQPSQYSMQAIDLARQLVRQQLTGAGYEISDQDFANATTADMKPGESLAMYEARIGGQLTPKEQADQFREDTKFQAWLDDRDYELGKRELTDQELIAKHNEFMSGRDASGLPVYDPTTGRPVTDSPAEQNAAAGDLADQASSGRLLQYLPYLPEKSKYGTAAQVEAITTRSKDGKKVKLPDSMGGDSVPPWVAAFALLSAASGDATGMSAEDFNEKIKATDSMKNLWAVLDDTQRSLLRLYLYDPSKDD